MTVQVEPGSISQEMIFRLRAKMDDYAYSRIEEGNTTAIAFRVPGEGIDMLNSLEYLSEFLSVKSLTGVDLILTVSDRSYEITPASVIGPKLELKKAEDQKLIGELREKMDKESDPIVFTTENDILELFRAAIRVGGSINRADSVVGLDLLRVNVPQEGKLIYLIFDDGYRKMSRMEFERLVDGSLSRLREGPKLARDQDQHHKMDASITPSNEAPGPKRPSMAFPSRRSGDAPLKDLGPTGVMRDFVKQMSAMGYREDVKFSRHDAHQVFLINLSKPAVFFKYLIEGSDLESFTRVLKHRSDAIGVLVTDEWDPGLEAVSRINGFLYLDSSRSHRAKEVLREVIAGGG